MFWAGAVTPPYFHLMRIPILLGRAFDDSDGEKSASVVIVSAAMARRYWPGQNPIGKHLRAVFESNWRTVVGVAGDVRQYDLANHSPDYIGGAMYMPYPQSVTNERQLPAAMTLIMRTGVRVALGASRRNIFGSVLGQSLRLVITGLAAGILMSLALTRMLGAFLYGTAANDLMTFCAVCGVLIGVALLAGYFPARRAASIDPLTALRVE